ncbi:MAG TPA: phospholipase D-like domain-containing protein [Actinospica sp.]|nr:phospholipase D-like domain-containing protein [Actinospica sp.]
MARRRSSRTRSRSRSRTSRSRSGWPSRRSGRSRGGGSGSLLLLAALIFGGGYAYLHAKGDLTTGHGATHGSSAHASTPAASAAPAGGGTTAAGGTAFVFATGGTSEPTIYKFIESAHSSLNMTMYELSDTTAVDDLVARKKAGVNVRIVLDQAEKTTNQSAFDTLQSAGIGVVWSATAYQYTHQKTITVDDRETLILTGNLTTKYYAETRDYGDFDTDANDVKAVVAVFDADYAHKSVAPGDADDLLWSPTTSRARVLSVIAGARRTLDVEGEEFSDSSVVNAVVARAKAGVAVRVLVESPSQYAGEIKKVVAAGGKVAGYSSSTGLYIHAKAVIADAGLSDRTVEFGSMNYTSTSLGRNRELGLVLHDAADVSLVEKQFAADFTGGAQQS